MQMRFNMLCVFCMLFMLHVAFFFAAQPRRHLKCRYFLPIILGLFNGEPRFIGGFLYFRNSSV